MVQVITTVSFTRSLPKRIDPGRAATRCGAVLLASALWLGAAAPVWAQTVAVPEAVPAVAELSAEADSGLVLRSTGEVVQLSAALHFELPTLVEDALYKGIPVHFVQSASMVSERWYWSDKLVAQVERHMRLSYQPLTRRWRLYSSSTPLNERGQGGGVALGVGFDSLDDALQAMQRITRWTVAELSQLPGSGELLVALQMRIDVAQLPRPLQIGTLGRKSWSVLESREQRVDVQALR